MLCMSRCPGDERWENETGVGDEELFASTGMDRGESDYKCTSPSLGLRVCVSRSTCLGLASHIAVSN